MLNYSHQVAVLIGTRSGTTLTGWQLESTYQAEGTTKATKTFDTGGFSKLNLDVQYVTGSAETNNSVEIKLEASKDGTNFFQLTNEGAVGGVSTLTQREFTFVGASAATTYTFTLGIDIFYKKMRVSAKETGVAANKGNVFVEATLSGK